MWEADEGSRCAATSDRILVIAREWARPNKGQGVDTGVAKRPRTE